jgi:hypothetical protein
MKEVDWLNNRKKLLNKVLNHNGIYMILSIDDDKIQIETNLLVSILEDQIIGIESMIDKQKEKFKKADKMKTAVEWLMEEYINGAIINIQIMKQAFEMERQQIIQSHEDAYLDCGFEYSASDCANDYYNKKFKL